MFAIAAETGWSEERVMFMPLARLAQYQHCLFRRNAVRTTWSNSAPGSISLQEQLENLRRQWRGAVDGEDGT